MRDCCLVLDTSALVYRAYYGLPRTIRTRQGLAINAVLGFYNTLSALIRQTQPHYLVAANDCPQPTFRHGMFSPYKAQRPPMPAELREQLPLIRTILQACQIPILELPGYEADDIIGTVCGLLPENTEAYIVSTDRDVLQLVNDRVSVLVPNSRANKIFTPQTVEFEWQVPPRRIPDLKALMGDSSDNIPGVPNVGKKTAARWLQRFGSLENLAASAHQLKGRAGENLRAHLDSALLYKKLATIHNNVPLFFCWQSCRLINDFSGLRPTLEDIGIRAALPVGPGHTA